MVGGLEAGCGNRVRPGVATGKGSAGRLAALASCLVLASVPGLAACATLRQVMQFQEPQVQLQEINVTGFSLTGGTLDLVLDVYNPNDYRLRSTRLEVSLDLEGTHFGDALINRPLDLSPVNHSRVVVPVRFDWAGASAGMRALLGRQSVHYTLGGAVLVDTPIGERRVGLKGSGDVPLKTLLR